MTERGWAAFRRSDWSG